MARLSDADIDRLDEYLGAHCGFTGGLPDSEALDGLLCAVVTSPEPIPPSEWMDAVWGPGHVFADAATAEEMLGLLMRAYQIVVDRVSDPAAAVDEVNDDLLPLVAYPDFDPDVPGDLPDMDDTGFLVGALWAHGFLLGRELRGEAWDDRIDDWEGLDEVLLEIDSLMIGLDDGDADDARGDPDDERLTLAERLVTLQQVPSLLHDLYLDAQQGSAPPPVPYRRETPKVGRNDPCPCGSGRKYKHCHGAG